MHLRHRPMAVVRFSDRPPSVHEAPLREPSEARVHLKMLDFASNV